MENLHGKFDDDSMSNMVAFFADRLNRIFAHYFCIIEFYGDKDIKTPPSFSHPRRLGLHSIQAACFHETLMALRDLDDVFSKQSKKKNDDLRISDYGYPGSLRFLSVSERNSINKAIAHSTTYGADISLRWDTFELVSKCVRQSLTFLEWIEKNEDWGSGFFCRTSIQSTYDYISRKIKEIDILQSI